MAQNIWPYNYSYPATKGFAMDVRNSMKFAINSGNVYCQLHLESQNKKRNLKKKRESEQSDEKIKEGSGYSRDDGSEGRPP